ncbi:MAG: TonB-dependent receptor [Calditrichaeota bacterium]|nr:TonB-dependent receptor [Calditrichota bacterium]
MKKQIFQSIRIILIAVVLLFETVLVNAQSTNASRLTQVIKGRVLDQQTKVGLIGANVMICGTAMGAATDMDGYFRIPKVPVGRYDIKVMYIGYKSRIIPEILVGSAKEIVQIIELEENIIQGETIVVTPIIEKNKPINSMTTVSARSFSVEETRRYAGGFDDPARLASSFAGVTYGNAQDNAIIIRGNAPKGLLWRLEGIEIPNPNHFPDGNVIGGGLFTTFSNQVLANSDFLTGAFPAEYGNALSGVFDMKMRNGNSEVREWTFQVGAMGIDFATEGPFTKNSNASYLVNYRYSTIGLLTDLKIIDTDQKLKYQDLSFKLNFPTKSAGTFSLWGIGSIDHINEIENTDSTKWEAEWDRLKYNAEFMVGAFGLNHKYVSGNSTFINSTVAATAKDMIYVQDRLDDNLMLRKNEFAKSFNGRIIVTSVLNHKFSPRLSNKTGIVWNYLFYDMKLQSTIDDDPETFQIFVEKNGKSQLLQAFTQTQFNVTNNLKLNAGVRFEYFGLNKNYSIEPRIGFNWNFLPRHIISFGYGKHSQLEDIRYYLAKRKTAIGYETPNRNLKFTRADHFILGYDFQITEYTRLKIEPYYQYLYDVPVRKNNQFSFINLKDELYLNDQLVNEGTGTNIGIDITLEKFLSENYYYLITASIFDSKYKGGDGIERNSRYNRNYVVNALFGKEFYLKNKNILGINGRFTYMGGERISPILYDASIAEKRVIYDESRAFEESLNDSKYLDITVTYRINNQNVAHIFALQVKNMLGSPNDYGYIYNYKEKNLQRNKMVVVLPSISYKIEF